CCARVAAPHLGYWILAGALLACAQYGYHTAVVYVPLALFAFLSALVFRPRDVACRLWGIAGAVFTFLAIYLPLLLGVEHELVANVHDKAHVDSLKLLAAGWWQVAKASVVLPDLGADWVVSTGRPMLLPGEGFAAALGLLWLTWRSVFGALLCVLWFAVVALGQAQLSSNPSFIHMLGGLPPLL